MKPTRENLDEFGAALAETFVCGNRSDVVAAIRDQRPKAAAAYLALAILEGLDSEDAQLLRALLGRAL